MSEIAVIIPCYNLGRTVEQALDSVLVQTRLAVEIVVVDDGSTDLYTRQLLESLERPNTRVVRTENRGLPAARNHGIRLTSAPYIVALDADDYLDPTYLEKTAARLDRESDLGFVTTVIQAFGEATYVWTPPPCTLIDAFTRGTAHPASLFRREIWNAVAGFDEKTFLSGCEDLDFWLSAMERGFRGDVVDEPLLHYRVSSNSMHQMNVSNGTHRLAMENVFRKHRETIESLGLDLYLAKEAFITDQRKYAKHLKVRQSNLERELSTVVEQIAIHTRALRESGQETIAGSAILTRSK